MHSRPPDGRTLLVAGDTLHVRNADGHYCTHGALARQLDQWFTEFDQIVIAAVLRPGTKVPTGFAPYVHANISFVPLVKAGGSGVRSKLGALLAALSWIQTLVPLLRRADVVHLRAPCNVTLVAIPLARFLISHRYAIYAGAWDPPAGGPVSYTVQRWMLRHFGGAVHVYAPRSADLSPNLRPNFSPTFSTAEIDELAGATSRRLDRIRLAPPSQSVLRVACVGRFSSNKNQAALIKAVAALAKDNIPVEVRFAGAGGTEDDAKDLASALGVADRIRFLGRQNTAELLELWEWADVNATVTLVEGFGRVTLEAMAVGCPTICGPGLMQGELVAKGARGLQVPVPQPRGLAHALLTFRNHSERTWVEMAQSCRSYAESHTIEAFGANVHDILRNLRGS